jgi:hypothetical protein
MARTKTTTTPTITGAAPKLLNLRTIESISFLECKDGVLSYQGVIMPTDS